MCTGATQKKAFLGVRMCWSRERQGLFQKSREKDEYTRMQKGVIKKVKKKGKKLKKKKSLFDMR